MGTLKHSSFRVICRKHTFFNIKFLLSTVLMSWKDFPYVMRCYTKKQDELDIVRRIHKLDKGCIQQYKSKLVM